jgi:hypothetical protein
MVEVVMCENNEAKFFRRASQSSDMVYYSSGATIESSIDKGQFFLNNQKQVDPSICYLVEAGDYFKDTPS